MLAEWVNEQERTFTTKTSSQVPYTVGKVCKALCYHRVLPLCTGLFIAAPLQLGALGGHGCVYILFSTQRGPKIAWHLA